MAELSITQELAEEGFFAGLDTNYMDFLVAQAERFHADQNRILFRHGNRAKWFYLISSGEISIEIPAIEGPTLELQSLGAGRILGWSWLIPPYKWSFQARAAEPSELIAINGVAVLERCEADPRFGYELFKRFSALMSRRLGEARERMMEEWEPHGFA